MLSKYDAALSAVLDADVVANAARAEYRAEAIRELETHFRAIKAICADMEAAGCYNPRDFNVIWSTIRGDRG
jgi:hypothetical protein